MKFHFLSSLKFRLILSVLVALLSALLMIKHMAMDIIFGPGFDWLALIDIRLSLWQGPNEIASFNAN